MATPPIAGLQLIWPTVSQLIVNSAVRSAHPRRRQAGLQPRVARTDDDHFIFVGRVHLHMNPARGPSRSRDGGIAASVVVVPAAAGETSDTTLRLDESTI